MDLRNSGILPHHHTASQLRKPGLEAQNLHQYECLSRDEGDRTLWIHDTLLSIPFHSNKI
jgi:hypothetical protein